MWRIAVPTIAVDEICYTTHITITVSGGRSTENTSLNYKLKDPGSIPPRGTIFFSNDGIANQ